LRVAQNIRDRLGGSLCLDDQFPYKPRGMHWTTYRRWRRRGKAAEGRWRHLIAEYCRRVPKRPRKTVGAA
jgi:hypothetical protein